EERAARLLERVRADLSEGALRQLDWLDWDEVARLVIGEGSSGRGTLLNGKLDYDNADNVARFLLAAELGQAAYDPLALARALRLAGPDRFNTDEQSALQSLPLESFHGHSPGESVYLLPSAQDSALAWRVDRARVYNYLHEGHHNLSLHAMLRKSVDL